MSLLAMLGQAAEIFRPTASPDGFGDARSRWPTNWQDSPAQTTKCRLQQSSGYENTNSRDVSVGQWKLFLPRSAPVTERDRVRVDGKLFEVVTVYPVHQRSGLHHYECDLVTYSGEVPRAE